jgi:hypothetical protein
VGTSNARSPYPGSMKSRYDLPSPVITEGRTFASKKQKARNARTLPILAQPSLSCYALFYSIEESLFLISDSTLIAVSLCFLLLHFSKKLK